MKKSLLSVLLLTFPFVLHADLEKDKALLKAIYFSDNVKAKQLIDEGANPNNTQIPGKDCLGKEAFEPPPIIVASRSVKTLETLRYILSHGGNSEIRSLAPDCPITVYAERTPILEAALYSKTPEPLELLLANGAKIDALDKTQTASVLSYAFQFTFGDRQTIEFLWKKIPLEIFNHFFDHVYTSGSQLSVSSIYWEYFARLLKQVDVNRIFVDSKGKIKTFLSTAIEKRSALPFIETALAAGANPNLASSEGTPLQLLLKNDSYPPAICEQIFDLLIKSGAKADLLDAKAAVENKFYGLAIKIFSSGVPINGLIAGKPLLYSEGKMGKLWLISLRKEQLLFLKEQGLDFNAKHEGETPLLTAARELPNPEAFETILKMNIDPNVVDPKTGATPFLFVARSMSRAADDFLITALLDKKASAILASHAHEIPLHAVFAHYYRHHGTRFENFIYPLIDASVSQINLVTKLYGERTPLMLLLRIYEEYVFYAHSSENAATWLQMLEKILTVGADPNIQNTFGSTALMELACFEGEPSLRATEILMANGAKKNLKSKTGKTVMDYAKACRPKPNQKLLDLLEKYPL